MTYGMYLGLANGSIHQSEFEAIANKFIHQNATCTWDIASDRKGCGEPKGWNYPHHTLRTHRGCAPEIIPRCCSSKNTGSEMPQEYRFANIFVVPLFPYSGKVCLDTVASMMSMRI